MPPIMVLAIIGKMFCLAGTVWFVIRLFFPALLSDRIPNACESVMDWRS